MANSSKSVVVIGGGIGGLFTAWKLCLKGMNVTVLERQKSVGGLSGSIHHDGFKIDIGPHYVILPKNLVLLMRLKVLWEVKILLRFLLFIKHTERILVERF